METMRRLWSSLAVLGLLSLMVGCHKAGICDCDCCCVGCCHKCPTYCLPCYRPGNACCDCYCGCPGCDCPCDGCCSPGCGDCCGEHGACCDGGPLHHGMCPPSVYGGMPHAGHEPITTTPPEVINVAPKEVPMPRPGM
ncbi:MAG: hypothetical protein ACK4RK_06475 [Gemmataceae bacterium]